MMVVTEELEDVLFKFICQCHTRLFVDDLPDYDDEAIQVFAATQVNWNVAMLIEVDGVADYEKHQLYKARTPNMVIFVRGAKNHAWLVYRSGHPDPDEHVLILERT